MARKTKYTYGQFASVCGKRYRVRKTKTVFDGCKKCVFHKFGECMITTRVCTSLIPINAHFEKV